MRPQVVNADTINVQSVARSQPDHLTPRARCFTGSLHLFRLQEEKRTRNSQPVMEVWANRNSLPRAAAAARLAVLAAWQPQAREAKRVALHRQAPESQPWTLLFVTRFLRSVISFAHNIHATATNYSLYCL